MLCASLLLTLVAPGTSAPRDGPSGPREPAPFAQRLPLPGPGRPSPAASRVGLFRFDLVVSVSLCLAHFTSHRVLEAHRGVTRGRISCFFTLSRPTLCMGTKRPLLSPHPRTQVDSAAWPGDECRHPLSTWALPWGDTPGDELAGWTAGSPTLVSITVVLRLQSRPWWVTAPFLCHHVVCPGHPTTGGVTPRKWNQNIRGWSPLNDCSTVPRGQDPQPNWAHLGG